MPATSRSVGVLLLCCCAAAAQDTAREAGLAREANHLDDAIVLYRKAVLRNPRWTEGWWYLGTLLYDRDDYSGAAAAFDKAAALDPKNGAALVMLGLSEAKLHRNTVALKHLRSGRQLGIPDDPQLRHVVLFTLGNLYLERGIRGDYEAAQEALDMLAAEGIESDELTDALGLAVLHMRPPAPDPELIRAAGKAEMLAARQRMAAAKSLYKQLATGYPKVSGVQFAYGKFLLAHQEDEQAVQAFQREIENTPTHVLARLGIAAIKSSSDPAGGLHYAQEAVKLAPEIPESHYLLGLMLLKTGDPLHAVAELETAQRAEPNEAKVYFALEQAYARIHRKEDAARARATFTRLNENSPHE